MTTKLISMNVGVILELEVDGKLQKIEFSAVCPSEDVPNPVFMVGELIDILNEKFGTSYYVGNSRKGSQVTIQIAKPKKIKAKRPISQKEFNRRIKEIGY